MDTNKTGKTVRPRQGTSRLVATRLSTLPPGTYTDPGQTALQLRVHKKSTGIHAPATAVQVQERRDTNSTRSLARDDARRRAEASARVPGESIARYRPANSAP